MRSHIPRWVMAAGGIVLILFGAGGLVTYPLTHRRASMQPESVLASGKEVRTVRLKTQDNLQIGAWWIETSSSARATFIVAHGNGASRSHMGPYIEALLERECHVLAVTLRAHGDSEGDVNDFGYSARHDLIAAVTEAEARAPGVPIGVLGTSLGAATALFAAPELETRVQAYVLESPFATLEIAVKNRLRMFLPRGLDTLAYVLMKPWAHVFLPVSPDRIAPVQAAARVSSQSRWWILAGDRDRRARLEEAVMIQQALPRAELHVFSGAAHSGLWSRHPAQYQGVLDDVVRSFHQ